MNGGEFGPAPGLPGVEASLARFLFEDDEGGVLGLEEDPDRFLADLSAYTCDSRTAMQLCAQ